MNELYAAAIHEVKNQLAELALRLRERGNAAIEMEIAINASRRLTKILMQERELWVNADAVNPADFLQLLAAEYTELFPHLTLKVDTQTAPGFAFFDESLVRMALGNALHNACRHAKSQIRLIADQKDALLLLQICDDGPGYPAGLLDAACELPLNASGAGTGLGLYLAAKIARLHQNNGQQGFIKLSNQPGACFQMFLP